MLYKKNPALEMEKTRGLFFAVGLVFSLSLVLTSFEWKFYGALEPMELKVEAQVVELEDLDIPTTFQPPPPPKTVLEQPEIIEVKNEEEILEDIEINLDIEMSEDFIPATSVYGEDIEQQAAPPPPPIKEEIEEVFLVVEEKPEPEGGFKAFYEYIAKKLKYPKAATKTRTQGQVYLQFIIDKDGSITNISVLKGIGMGCDEEAVRVLSSSPKWKPGKQRGHPVKVKVSVPIRFKLAN